MEEATPPSASQKRHGPRSSGRRQPCLPKKSRRRQRKSLAKCTNWKRRKTTATPVQQPSPQPRATCEISPSHHSSFISLKQSYQTEQLDKNIKIKKLAHNLPKTDKWLHNPPRLIPRGNTTKPANKTIRTIPQEV